MMYPIDVPATDIRRVLHTQVLLCLVTAYNLGVHVHAIHVIVTRKLGRLLHTPTQVKRMHVQIFVAKNGAVTARLELLEITAKNFTGFSEALLGTIDKAIVLCEVRSLLSGPLIRIPSILVEGVRVNLERKAGRGRLDGDWNVMGVMKARWIAAAEAEATAASLAVHEEQWDSDSDAGGDFGDEATGDIDGEMVMAPIDSAELPNRDGAESVQGRKNINVVRSLIDDEECTRDPDITIAYDDIDAPKTDMDNIPSSTVSRNVPQSNTTSSISTQIPIPSVESESDDGLPKATVEELPVPPVLLISNAEEAPSPHTDDDYGQAPLVLDSEKSSHHGRDTTAGESSNVKAINQCGVEKHGVVGCASGDFSSKDRGKTAGDRESTLRGKLAFRGKQLREWWQLQVASPDRSLRNRESTRGVSRAESGGTTGAGGFERVIRATDHLLERVYWAVPGVVNNDAGEDDGCVGGGSNNTTEGSAPNAECAVPPASPLRERAAAAYATALGASTLIRRYWHQQSPRRPRGGGTEGRQQTWSSRIVGRGLGGTAYTGPEDAGDGPDSAAGREGATGGQGSAWGNEALPRRKLRKLWAVENIRVTGLVVRVIINKEAAVKTAGGVGTATSGEAVASSGAKKRVDEEDRVSDVTEDTRPLDEDMEDVREICLSTLHMNREELLPVGDSGLEEGLTTKEMKRRLKRRLVSAYVGERYALTVQKITNRAQELTGKVRRRINAAKGSPSASREGASMVVLSDGAHQPTTPPPKPLVPTTVNNLELPRASTVASLPLSPGGRLLTKTQAAVSKILIRNRPEDEKAAAGSSSRVRSDEEDGPKPEKALYSISEAEREAAFLEQEFLRWKKSQAIAITDSRAQDPSREA